MSDGETGLPSNEPEGFNDAYAALANEPEDEQAWRRVQSLADSSLRRLISRNLASSHDVDDVLAELWMRLLFRLRKAKGHGLPDSPWAYICKTAINRSIDFLRKRDVTMPNDYVAISHPDVRESSEGGMRSAVHEIDPISVAMASDLAAYLEASLAPREWAVLMDYAAGYDFAEIADRHSLTAANARQIKYRAVLRMDAILVALGETSRVPPAAKRHK